MPDPLGIIGVIGVAGQIIQTVIKFEGDWKDAPADTRSFVAEVQALKTVLSETNTNILLNDDFKDAFHGRHSTLVSQLGDTAQDIDTHAMVSACKEELESLLEDLKKRVHGHRIGWERLKGAFLAKTTREAVESLHRQCQTLNSLMSMDALSLGVSIHKEAREARTEQQRRHADGEHKAIVNWLTTVDYGPQQSDFIGRRQEGTGQWLLNSTQYQEWSKTASQTLFCPGIPGAGKTILSSIVIDDLYTRFQNNGRVGIAYLYCDFRRQVEQKAGDLLASLLKQLSQGLPSLPECVKSLHNQHKDMPRRPSFGDISRNLQSVAAFYSQTFIIVDALDECQRNDGNRARFLTEIFDFQAACGANIFATSRHIPEITDRFSASTILEIRARDDDVRKYLDGRILQSGRGLLGTCREEIKNGITKAVDGMFLLAQLHFEFVSRKTTLRKLKDALKNLPTGPKAYDQAYDEAMKRIAGFDADSENLAKQVLSWITCAKRRLTPSELQHALAVEDGDSELDEENLPPVEEMVSVCVGLVIIDEESDIIRLVHYTAQEYFQRTQKVRFPSAETDIARVCATYLSFSTFDGGFNPTEKDIQDRRLQNPLFEYAVKNWVLHARYASPAADPFVSPLLSSGSKVPSSCLLWAARDGQELIIEWLLERHVDVNVRDTEWKTPLHHAVLHSWAKCIQLLLARGAKMTADIDNMTPLHYTVSTGNEEIAQVLLDAGVSVDALVERRVWLATYTEGKLTYVPSDDPHCPGEVVNTSQGLTALHYAALTGSTRMTIFFLERSADPNVVSEYGETPVHLAVRQDIHSRQWTPGNNGDRWNDPDFRIEVTLGLIDSDLDGEKEYCSTLRVIVEHRLGVLDGLLARPEIDVNARDAYGASPLHCIRYGKLCSQRVLEKLLQKNTIVSVRNLKSQTPLHLACLAGDTGSLTALIKHGANVMDHDDDGLNALHCAARSGDKESIRVILDIATDRDSRALATARDKHGRNALHHLLTRNGGDDLDAVRCLLLSGVGVNDLDDCGNSPLAIYLAKFPFPLDKAQVVRLLFQSGADPLFATKGGLGLGHLAAESYTLDTGLLSVLASSGVDLLMQDAEGRTVLHHVAMAGSLTGDALDFLCNDIGLSRDSPDALGLTPLDYAAKMRKKDHHPDTFDGNRWSRTEEILRGQ